MHKLSAQAAAALRALCDYRPTPEEVVLTGELIRSGRVAVFPLSAAPDEISIVLSPLPGRTVVGAARTNDRLWVFLDLAKADARRHLLQLIDTWPLAADYSREILSVPAHNLKPMPGGAPRRLPLRRSAAVG